MRANLLIILCEYGVVPVEMLWDDHVFSDVEIVTLRRNNIWVVPLCLNTVFAHFAFDFIVDQFQNNIAARLTVQTKIGKLINELDWALRESVQSFETD